MTTSQIVAPFDFGVSSVDFRGSKDGLVVMNDIETGTCLSAWQVHEGQLPLIHESLVSCSSSSMSKWFRCFPHTLHSSRLQGFIVLLLFVAGITFSRRFRCCKGPRSWQFHAKCKYDGVWPVSLQGGNEGYSTGALSPQAQAPFRNLLSRIGLGTFIRPRSIPSVVTCIVAGLWLPPNRC